MQNLDVVKRGANELKLSPTWREGAKIVKNFKTS